MGRVSALRKGQLYKFRAPAKGAKWRYLKIVGISDDGRIATWEEVSKNGNKKRKGRFHRGRTHLVWRSEEWRMPEHYQLMTG